MSATVTAAGDLEVTVSTVNPATKQIVKTTIPKGAGGAVFTQTAPGVVSIVVAGATLTVGASAAPPPVYPLPMPAGITNGAAVTLGTGPVQLVIEAANNPNTQQACSFGVILDGEAIAGPLVLSSWAGESGGQVFTINGDWQPLPNGASHAVEIAGEGSGDVAIWINAVTFGLVPLVTQTGGVNMAGCWASQGQTVTFSAPVAVVAPPPPPTLSLIPATISVDGIASELVTDTLANLCAKISENGTLKLSPGHWIGSANVTVPCTIDLGGSTIDGAGYLLLASGKGLFCNSVAGVHYQNGTLTHAGCSSLNGAGIREEAQGCDWSASNITFLQCQMGVLTEGSNVTLTDCITTDCGWDGTVAGIGTPGECHNMYFNQGPLPTTVAVTLINHTSIGGQYTGHEGKFRCDVSISGTSNFSATVSGANAGVYQGSVIDFPNGGVFVMNGGTITLPPDTVGQDTQFFTYGAEISTTIVANPGTAATFAGVAFVGAGIIQSALPTATLDVTGSTYSGATPPATEGYASVIGNFAQVAK